MKRTGAILGLWLCCSLFANTYCQVGDSRSSLVVNSGRSETERSREQVDVTHHRNVGLINRWSCGRSSKIGMGYGNTTSIFEIPWMVYLTYRNDEKPGKEIVACGGTLINDRYVLTAAHCILNYTRHKLVSVRLGEHDTSTEPDCETGVAGAVVCAPSPQNINVERFVKHPGYSPRNLQHNIGLIRLAEPADLLKENINTICLPVGLAEQKRNLDGKPMVVAGWGITQHGVVNSKVVKKALVTVVPQQQCQAVYQPHGVNITGTHVCAREVDLDRQRACAGISGGGALQTAEMVNEVTSLVQYGVLSFGNRLCDHNGVPDVYTRVDCYMDWILDNLAR